MPAKQFKYSIIMSVYNVEPYIDEAVQSVLEQTIGFAENIQIVFVNDGSTDGSGEACKKYQSLYPDNVVYVEQENKGLSAARNLGLTRALGSYINFLDPDDLLSVNTIEEVDKFLHENEAEIDFVSIPLVYFEGQKGLHGKYKRMGKRNRVIDLLVDPDCFVLSSAGSFYKAKVFEKNKFDESLGIGEDAELNFRLYNKNPRFGYVCEKEVVYHYRRRLAGGSNVDALRVSKSTKPFRDNIQIIDGMLERRNAVREFEKEYIAYQLRAILHDAQRATFGADYSWTSFMVDCRRVARVLDLDFILRGSAFIDTDARKELFLALIGSSFHDAMKSGFAVPSCFDVKLKDIAFENGQLIVDVLYNSYGCPLDLVVVDSGGGIFEASREADFSSSFDVTYGEFALDETHYRQFTLPYAPSCYRFCFRNTETGIVTACKILRATGKPPLMSLGRDLGVVRDGKKVFLKSSSLEVVEESKNSFFVGVETFKAIKKHSNKAAWLCPLSRRKKKYVLVMDRPNKAGDNAQALYEHIMKSDNRKLKKQTYFVLDKKSAEYGDLCCKSHVVQPRSLRHKLLFLNARLVYSSHNARQFYVPFAHYGKYYADELDYGFVWLQHGICENGIAKQANRLTTEDDYIVTSVRGEAEMFRSREYFYSPDQILLTGLPRYDKLVSDTKKLITIAPTWRSSLSGKILKDGTHEPRPGFEESEYYKVFMALLTSSKLKRALKESGYKCQFLCHPGFACYEKYFKAAESDNIFLLPQSRADYSKIFAESAIFITDFSSTAFDFAYLKKPLIYFQFDELTQYEPGWFSYDEDGLGPVIKTVDGVVDYIEMLLERNCEVEEKYASRIDDFFVYRDRNNCARILDATLPDDLK